MRCNTCSLRGIQSVEQNIRWEEGLEQCINCVKKIKSKEFCTVCTKIYTETDNIIKCVKCNLKSHLQCDSSLTVSLAVFESYICIPCRKTQKNSRIVELVHSLKRLDRTQEFSGRVSDVLKAKIQKVTGYHIDFLQIEGLARRSFYLERPNCFLEDINRVFENYFTVLMPNDELYLLADNVKKSLTEEANSASLEVFRCSLDFYLFDANIKPSDTACDWVNALFKDVSLKLGYFQDKLKGFPLDFFGHDLLKSVEKSKTAENPLEMVRNGREFEIFIRKDLDLENVRNIDKLIKKTSERKNSVFRHKSKITENLKKFNFACMKNDNFQSYSTRSAAINYLPLEEEFNLNEEVQEEAFFSSERAKNVLSDSQFNNFKEVVKVSTFVKETKRFKKDKKPKEIVKTVEIQACKDKLMFIDTPDLVSKPICLECNSFEDEIKTCLNCEQTFHSFCTFFYGEICAYCKTCQECDKTGGLLTFCVECNSYVHPVCAGIGEFVSEFVCDKCFKCEECCSTEYNFSRSTFETKFDTCLDCVKQVPLCGRCNEEVSERTVSSAEDDLTGDFALKCVDCSVLLHPECVEFDSKILSLGDFKCIDCFSTRFGISFKKSILAEVLNKSVNISVIVKLMSAICSTYQDIAENKQIYKLMRLTATKHYSSIMRDPRIAVYINLLKSSTEIEQLKKKITPSPSTVSTIDSNYLAKVSLNIDPNSIFSFPPVEKEQPAFFREQEFELNRLLSCNLLPTQYDPQFLEENKGKPERKPRIGFKQRKRVSSQIKALLNGELEPLNYNSESDFYFYDEVKYFSTPGTKQIIADLTKNCRMASYPKILSYLTKKLSVHCFNKLRKIIMTELVSNIRKEPTKPNKNMLLDLKSKANLVKVVDLIDSKLENSVSSCFLCGREGRRKFSGRLIHCKDSHFVHVNCLFWSRGIKVSNFEVSEFSHLFGNASKNRKCGICKEKNATLVCSSNKCSASFHFACGIVEQGNFLQTGFLCSKCNRQELVLPMNSDFKLKCKAKEDKSVKLAMSSISRVRNTTFLIKLYETGRLSLGVAVRQEKDYQAIMTVAEDAVIFSKTKNLDLFIELCSSKDDNAYLDKIKQHDSKTFYFGEEKDKKEIIQSLCLNRRIH